MRITVPRKNTEVIAMSTMFDFGFGEVPAHQHVNGGGWVADTAYVDGTAYVGPNAEVADIRACAQKACATNT